MTVAVTGNEIAELLAANFPDAVELVDDTGTWIAKDSFFDVCKFLRNDPKQDFALLNSITAVDYVDHFDVVYHLTSISRNALTVLKSRLDGRENLEMPSVTSIWQGSSRARNI